MYKNMLKYLNTNFSPPLEWLTGEPRALTSLGFIRSVYGLTTLALLVTSWPIRHLLFGPSGLLSKEDIKAQWRSPESWSVFDLAANTLTFDLIYVFFIFIAILTMLGVGGRLILLLNYIGTWSLFSQNPLIGDGGDNLMYICGIFLLFTDCFNRFTILKYHPRRMSVSRTLHLPCWAINIVHNTGVLLIAVQICIVYFIAGTFKMQGEMWTNGTALYYVLRNPEYYIPGVEFLFYFAAPSVIGAYLTVLSQVFFPFLVVFRGTRVWAVIIMMTFHIGIATIMGLTSFALLMFACDTIFVSGHLSKLVSRFTGSSKGAPRRGSSKKRVRLIK